MTSIIAHPQIVHAFISLEMLSQTDAFFTLMKIIFTLTFNILITPAYATISLKNFFNREFINLFNMHAPIKRYENTVGKRKSSPWLTASVRLVMKLHDKALQNLKKSLPPRTLELL